MAPKTSEERVARYNEYKKLRSHLTEDFHTGRLNADQYAKADQDIKQKFWQGKDFAFKPPQG